MDHSLKTAISFGLTSAVITTLGLMVGLNAGTHSKLVVIGGILSIAIADAFSDALGIHLSEESEDKHTDKEIWQSTLYTFIFKFIFAMTFMLPVLFLELSHAIIVCIVWGLFLLATLSFSLAREQKANPWKAVSEHLAIALLVIAITNTVGSWIFATFS